MIIAYGNNDDALTSKEVTKDELTDIIQSNEMVNLVRVENTEIDENGFFDVQNGITSIRDEAFNSCTSLTNITLPEGLTNIGGFAFLNCSCLTSITLPEGITNIGVGIFQGCSNLSTITLPEGITNIGVGAFQGCSNLSTITLPEGITSIGVLAFDGCSSLTTITLPEGITSIEAGAFYGCSSLETIIIDGDEDEVERVKELLPEEHRDKVVSKSLFEQALLAQKEVIVDLASTPQFSSLYKWLAYLKPTLPDSILGIINSYLIDNEFVHPIFETGRQRLQNVSLRHFFSNPLEYIRELSDIKDYYKKIAEETIKPSIKWQFYDAKKETSIQEEKTEAAVTKRPYN